MSTQHTPAPWINDGKTISAQVDPAHPSYIAPVCFLDGDWLPEIVAANARLIAAAPALLAALQGLVGEADLGEIDHDDDTRELIERARAAIELATGAPI